MAGRDEQSHPSPRLSVAYGPRCGKGLPCRPRHGHRLTFPARSPLAAPETHVIRSPCTEGSPCCSAPSPTRCAADSWSGRSSSPWRSASAGAVLSSLEEQVPALGAWVPATLFPSRQDPQVAQVILSAIATSIMTVVSIVFAILLMTLTLASTQFSPRILVSFVRDRARNGPWACFSARSPTAWRCCRPRAPCRLRAGGHRHRRHAAGAGRGRLADVLHPPHLAGDQRQPHRRSHRARNRAGDRRADAASAPEFDRRAAPSRAIAMARRS